MGESMNRACILALLMTVAGSEMARGRVISAWLLYALILCLVLMEICERKAKKGGGSGRRGSRWTD
jgi:hypothetical protein